MMGEGWIRYIYITAASALITFIALLFVIILLLCLGFLANPSFPNPCEHVFFCCNVTEVSATIMDVSTYGYTTLGVIIALCAFIIAFVAFLVPFMIIATGNYQMFFFNTVAVPAHVHILVENNLGDNILKTIKHIETNAKKMNELYRYIMIRSIAALILTIVFIVILPIIFGSERYLLFVLLFILLVYLAMMISKLWWVNQVIFGKSNGSYSTLAQIQCCIINDLIKKESKERDEKPKEER